MFCNFDDSCAPFMIDQINRHLWNRLTASCSFRNVLEELCEGNCPQFPLFRRQIQIRRGIKRLAKLRLVEGQIKLRNSTDCDVLFFCLVLLITCWSGRLGYCRCLSRYSRYKYGCHDFSERKLSHNSSCCEDASRSFQFKGVLDERLLGSISGRKVRIRHCEGKLKLP